MKENIIPVDGMVIMEDTAFAPGLYPLPNGITIGADGIKLTGKGVTLVNQSHEDAAIHAENRANITIQDIAIVGYYHGVHFDHCRNITIDNVRVRDTAEIVGIDTFLYLWHPIEKVYSGAILLNDVQGGSVQNCDAQHQMNGILLYGCSNVTIENNNASFNSGWGVYLSASNDNTIQDNRLDFCNRVYRRPENGSVGLRRMRQALSWSSVRAGTRCCAIAASAEAMASSSRDARPTENEQPVTIISLKITTVVSAQTMPSNQLFHAAISSGAMIAAGQITASGWVTRGIM